MSSSLLPFIKTHFLFRNYDASFKSQLRHLKCYSEVLHAIFLMKQKSNSPELCVRVCMVPAARSDHLRRGAGGAQHLLCPVPHSAHYTVLASPRLGCSALDSRPPPNSWGLESTNWGRTAAFQQWPHRFGKISYTMHCLSVSLNMYSTLQQSPMWKLLVNE